MSPAAGPSVTALDDGHGTWDRRWLLALLVVLAAALRLHGLGSQLWLDEMDALLVSIRRPALDIVMRWPSTTSHVLHDLCSHLSVRALGESAFAVRLPAALFGVGGVAALFLFAEPVLGRRVGAVAGALLAVSYPHVFYSQNARGYTALLFFALLASRGLLRFREGRGGRTAYVVTGALAAYSVVLGVFVVAGHVVVAGASAVFGWWRGRKPPIDMRRYAIAAALAAALIALLYAPMAAHLLRFTRGQARLPAATEHTEGHGGPAARLGVATDAIEGLGRGFGGRGGLALAAVVAALGAARWVRRDGLSLAVLVVPVALELAVLLAADVPLSPRYFALALCPLTIALAAGLVAVADAVARLLKIARAPKIGDALLAAVVIAAALPLRGYYRVPKQDFQGAMDRVAGLAAAGDARIAVHYAARGICGFYGAGFQDVQALSDLEAQEKTGRRLWLVTTLERFLAAEAPALHAHIQSSYRRVAVLPGTVGGAEMNIYERKEARF